VNLNRWLKFREKRKEREVIHDTSKKEPEVTVVRPENEQDEIDLFFAGPPVDSTKRRKVNAG
jgi:hypothetical protein